MFLFSFELNISAKVHFYSDTTKEKENKFQKRKTTLFPY